MEMGEGIAYFESSQPTMLCRRIHYLLQDFRDFNRGESIGRRKTRPWSHDKNGFQPNVCLDAKLVSTYAKFGCIEDAH